MGSIAELNQKSIEDIGTISCGDVSAVQELPNLFARHGIFPDDAFDLPEDLPEGFEAHEIVSLQSKLHLLWTTLEQYDPSLIWRIIDIVCSIFTGKVCNIWRLNRSLPEVRSVVDKIAQKALKAPSGPDPVDAAEAKDKDAVAKDYDTVPLDVIAKKLKLADRVVDLTKDPGKLVGKLPSHSVFAIQKIHKIFTKIQKRLQKGKNAAIPQYLHATKENLYDWNSCTYYEPVDKILKDKLLKMKKAERGTGVFVSNQNEGFTDSGDYISYGPFTFGLDAYRLEQVAAHYFQGDSHSLSRRTFWVCLKDNIPIKPGVLGCMITDVGRISKLAGMLKNGGYNPRTFEPGDDKELADKDMPLLTFGEGKAMRDVIEMADVEAQLSDKWLLENSYDKFLPLNLQHPKFKIKRIPAGYDIHSAKV